MKALAWQAMLVTGSLLIVQGMAQTSATGKVQAFGLPGKRVTALAVTPTNWPQALLYATTEQEGVFRRSLATTDSIWLELGLQGKNLTAIDLQVWGWGPLDFHTPIVGLMPDCVSGDSTLIYRLEESKWVPADSGIIRGETALIKALASFRSGGHLPPGAAFAGGSGVIYRSHTFSNWWQGVLSVGIGATNVLAIHQRSNFSGTIWAGGENGIFAPWIATSDDGGETWEIFYPDLHGDNACNSLAIHPDHPDTVYAGMEGAVIKTIDGGKTWKYTGLRDTPVYFYGLALDNGNPEHVYAGGLIANPNSWALWESFDGGASWREIPAPLLVTPVVISGITSIVADPQKPRVIYLATLGHGVWRYESVTTGVADRGWPKLPTGFWLAQNVPNPFNPETLIHYHLAASHHVKLEVFDLLGQRLATLVDERQPAGEHQARWQGRNAAGKPAASGVYFYRLSLDGKAVATRKMLLAHLP